MKMSSLGIVAVALAVGACSSLPEAGRAPASIAKDSLLGHWQTECLPHKNGSFRASAIVVKSGMAESFSFYTGSQCEGSPIETAFGFDFKEPLELLPAEATSLQAERVFRVQEGQSSEQSATLLGFLQRQKQWSWTANEFYAGFMGRNADEAADAAAHAENEFCSDPARFHATTDGVYCWKYTRRLF